MANGLEPQITSKSQDNQRGSGLLNSLKDAFSNVDLNFDSSTIADAFLEAPEKLSREDLFPALNRPLKVGTAGGSETGQVGIFVGGGDIFPTEVINARVRALSKASKSIAAENKKLEESFEFLDTADQFEGALNGQLIDLTEEFRQKYKNDWRKANKDPEFRKRFAELKSNAGRFTSLSDKAVGIMQAVKDGKQHVPKIAKQAAIKIANGSSNFEDLTKEEIFALEKDLITYESMTAGATRIASKIERDFTTEFETLSFNDKKIVNSALNNMRAGDFSGLAQIKKTMPSISRTLTVANADYDNGNYGNIDNESRREEYSNLVLSLMGSKTEVSFQKLQSQDEKDNLDQKLDNEKTRAEAAKTNADAAWQRQQNEKSKIDNKISDMAKMKAALKKAKKIISETDVQKDDNNQFSMRFTDKDQFFDDNVDVKVEKQYDVPDTEFAATGDINVINVVSNDATKVGRQSTISAEGLSFNKIVEMRVASRPVTIDGVDYKKGDVVTGFDYFTEADVTDKNGNTLDKVQQYTSPKMMFVLTGSGDNDLFLTDYNPKLNPHPLNSPSDSLGEFTDNEEKGIKAVMKSENLTRNQAIAALKRAKKLK